MTERLLTDSYFKNLYYIDLQLLPGLMYCKVSTVYSSAL